MNLSAIFRRWDCEGFTLTEVLVTIAVMVVMAGVGYSGYSSWQRREQARAAAYDLAGHLKEARFRTLEKNVAHTTVFNGNTYTIFADLNGNLALDPGERTLYQVNVSQKNPGVTLTAPEGLIIHYDGRGIISFRDSANTNLLGATISFVNTANTYTVTISSLGRIKIEP